MLCPIIACRPSTGARHEAPTHIFPSAASGINVSPSWSMAVECSSNPVARLSRRLTHRPPICLRYLLVFVHIASIVYRTKLFHLSGKNRSLILHVMPHSQRLNRELIMASSCNHSRQHDLMVPWPVLLCLERASWCIFVGFSSTVGKGPTPTLYLTCRRLHPGHGRNRHNLRRLACSASLLYRRSSSLNLLPHLDVRRSDFCPLTNV